MNENILIVDDDINFFQKIIDTIYNNINDSVCIIELKNYKILSANKTFFKNLGINKNDIIGKTCHDIINHKTSPRILNDNRCPLTNILETGKQALTTHIHYDNENNKKYFEITAIPIKNANGKISQAIHIKKDITERKQIGNQKKKELQRKDFIYKVRKAIDNIPMGNIEKKFKLILKRLAKIIGAKRLTIMIPENNKLRIVSSIGINKSTKDYIDASSDQLTSPISNYILNSGGEVIIKNEKDLNIFQQEHPDFNFKRKGGKTFCSFPLVILPFGEKNNILGVINVSDKDHFSNYDIKIIRDFNNIIAYEILAEKIFNDELEKKIENEKQINEKMMLRAQRLTSLGELTSSIAHEIRQPLHVIKMITDGIIYFQKNKKTQNKEIQENMIGLEKILKGTERIDKLIQNIYNIAKAPEKIIITDININSIIQEVIEFYKQKIKNHNITLKLNLDQNVRNIKSSKIQMEQVITNLLSNAIKALDKIKKNDKKIIINTVENNEFVLLEVIDNGPGIKEDIKEKIFDPLFTTSLDETSIGMGLYIVNNILQVFNSTIEVCDNDLGGAVFRIRLLHDY